MNLLRLSLAIEQAGMKRKCDNIIRVTITSGATIKVSIYKIDRCTRGINTIGEKLLSRGLKNPNPRRNIGSYPYLLFSIA
jgi:hypothetical protein